MTNQMTLNLNTILVDINEVISNPLNPRKNNAIKSDEMQRILLEKGWEEPLTAYKKGTMYVLLAGHRRLYAARQAKVKQIPIYLVEAPKDEAEEIERIASLQSGRVNWSTYEWAQFAYDSYIAWKKPSMKKLSEMTNINTVTLKMYIETTEYFPKTDLQHYEEQKLPFSTLHALCQWIKALKKHKPDLVNAMTEGMILKVMIEKMINRKVNRDDLRNRDYCELATLEQIREFLVDKDMELKTQFGYFALKKNFKEFNGHLISLGHLEKRIPNIEPYTDRQKEKAVNALKDLEKLIQERLRALEK